MSEHTWVRELLPLAASGVLDAAEQRRVDAHVAECPGCAAELTSWASVTAAIREAPPPELSVGLAARTRQRVQHEMAARSERRFSDVMVACLILLGWTVTALMWMTWRLLTGGGVEWVGVDTGSPVVWLAGSTVLAWLTAGAAAALLAPGRQGLRRS